MIPTFVALWSLASLADRQDAPNGQFVFIVGGILLGVEVLAVLTFMAHEPVPPTDPPKIGYESSEVARK